MDNFTIEKRDEWLSKNADIVELLKKNGFNIKITDTTSYLLFFEKQLDFPFSLGEDIKNETLELPNYYNKTMIELRDKYNVRINFPNFNTKKIVREHNIFWNYCIRLNLNRKRFYEAEEITVMVLGKDLKRRDFLYDLLSGKDSKYKKDTVDYFREKGYRTEINMENVEIAIKDAKKMMTKVSKIINDNIPKVIEEMRAEIENHYKEYKQALVSMKLRKFLDGFLLQFDALNNSK